MLDAIRLAKPSRATPIYILAVTLLVALVDYLTGPAIHFPILYTVPVALAAWFGYTWLSAASAIVLAALRGVLELRVWASDPSPVVVFANLAIRLAVLFALIVLLLRIGRSVRELVREVAILQGILPICAYCKRIRDGQQNWQTIETYVAAHSDATFSHGICPTCLEAQFQNLDRLESGA